MVKYLLSMRSQNQWPKDPQAHLVDFFGQYRDPMWDNMEQWKAEMEEIRDSMPALNEQIDNLQNQLAFEKRKTWALNTYKACDADGSVS